MPPNSPERGFCNANALEQLMTDVEDVTAHQFLQLRLPAQIEFEQKVDELFAVGSEDFDVLACVLEEWFSVENKHMNISILLLPSSLKISSYFF